VAGEQLAFGPATVTLFGVIVPVFPAVAGMLSVFLARLIAPKDTPTAPLTGMLMGGMGLLVPETGVAVFWSWFKEQLRGWLRVPMPPPSYTSSGLPQEERLRIAQKIFRNMYPTDPVPTDLEEIVEKLKKL
jgi:hypothetical protein